MKMARHLTRLLGVEDETRDHIIQFLQIWRQFSNKSFNSSIRANRPTQKYHDRSTLQFKLPKFNQVNEIGCVMRPVFIHNLGQINCKNLLGSIFEVMFRTLITRTYNDGE